MTQESAMQWAKENKPLTLAVRNATAFAQAEKARVNAYIKPIFDTYTFYNDREVDGPPHAERTRITGPELMYLSTDEEQAARYYQECDAAHVKHGWQGTPGCCPALVAHHQQILAENTLIEAGGKLCGIEGRTLTLEKRAAFIDLLFRLCINA